MPKQAPLTNRQAAGPGSTRVAMKPTVTTNTSAATAIIRTQPTTA